MRNTSHSVVCVPMVICVAVCLLANCANVGSGGYSSYDTNSEIVWLKFHVKELQQEVRDLRTEITSVDVEASRERNDLSIELIQLKKRFDLLSN